MVATQGTYADNSMITVQWDKICLGILHNSVYLSKPQRGLNGKLPVAKIPARTTYKDPLVTCEK